MRKLNAGNEKGNNQTGGENEKVRGESERERKREKNYIVCFSPDRSLEVLEIRGSWTGNKGRRELL